MYECFEECPDIYGVQLMLYSYPSMMMSYYLPDLSSLLKNGISPPAQPRSVLPSRILSLALWVCLNSFWILAPVFLVRC
jgi:hypothetical protein